MSTLIAWTDETVNVWWGCSKISAGCTNCYAATDAKRYGWDVWGLDKPRRAISEKTNQTKLRKQNEASDPGVMGSGQPRLIFIGSEMDWAEDHPDANRLRPRIWEMIRQYPQLHFQLLTKRADRVAELLPADWGAGYPNVWLGTSIENMAVSWRADALRAIPATVRFISFEPALEGLDEMDLTGIDWIIYGGESGGHRRAENKDWARAMRDRCRASGIAFFHKQSNAFRSEQGIELDGEVIRQFPIPKTR